MSKASLNKQDAEDHLYWMRVADILGAQLIGWTFRSTGLVGVGNPRRSIPVDGYVALRITELDNARIEIEQQIAKRPNQGDKQP